MRASSDSAEKMLVSEGQDPVRHKRAMPATQKSRKTDNKCVCVCVCVRERERGREREGERERESRHLLAYCERCAHLKYELITDARVSTVGSID